MIERQKRLNEVYEYLRKNMGIHTQTDFAEALNYTRSVISAALNGKESYLTDKLFENICKAFPGVFNIHYLLTGEDSLLLGKSEDAAPKVEREPIGIMDQSSLINAAIAAKDETIESLKRELKTKDDLISTLRARIADLEARADTNKYTKLSDYPFDVGVAEP